MMRGMPLPQHPARVKVTLADGTVGWLADPPEAPTGAQQRWQLVDNRADAGVWPWPRALELERAARQPWRRQYAAAEPVNPGPPPVFRADIEDRARERARACGVPDPSRVVWVSFGFAGPAFGYDDDRDPVLLPPITTAG
jgi:hypothetical protein